MKLKIFSLLVLAAAIMLSSCVSSQQRLAEQREKDPQYQYDKAAVCMQYGLMDEAFKYLNQALTVDPRHYLSYNLLGLAHMMKGNLAEATKAFEKCVEINPNFSEAHNNLGMAYQESDALNKAEEEYKKALAIDANYNASYNLAKLYYSKNQLDTALAYVQKSLQKYNKSVLALNLQGLIIEGQGKLDEAVASYEQALRIAPDEQNVKFNLAVTYFKKEDFAKAKEILEKILLALEKKSPNAQNADLKSKVNDLLSRIKLK